MDEYEMDGAHAEIERLAAHHQSKKPLYSDRMVSKQTAGTEGMGAPPDTELSHDDVLAAVRELAEQHGVSTARVRGMLMLTAAKSGLGYSLEEQAQVLGEVMLTLQRGQDEVSDDRILALSGRGGDGLASLAPELSIPDEAHLKAAAILVRSKTGDWAGAGQLIARRAAELGAPDPLDSSGPLAASPSTVQLAISMAGAADSGDAEVPLTAGTTQETRALALAAGSGGRDSAAAVEARHPELAYMFRAGRTSSRRHPRKSGTPVNTKSRAHSSDLDDDTQDTDQPAKGGQPHRRGAAAIMADNPELFGTREAATGNFSTSPKSAAQREAEEKRQLAGGRSGGRSIPDLSAGSARTRHGR